VAHTRQKYSNEKSDQWHHLITDFSAAETRDALGLQLPVIALNELLAYKKILARKVDLLDIAELTLAKT
jgi:hypothetical protein